MIREILKFTFTPWRNLDRLSRFQGFTSLAVVVVAIAMQFWDNLVPVMLATLSLLVVLVASNVIRSEIRGRRAARKLSRECDRMRLVHKLLNNEVALDDLSPEERADIMPLYTKYKLNRS